MTRAARLRAMVPDLIRIYLTSGDYRAVFLLQAIWRSR